MKKLGKALHAIVIAGLILLLPISAIAMEYTGGGTSVPEPSTLELLTASGGGILILKRYRKNK